ncbi:MAG: 50S ribosomal protein L19e [Candidatus Lokiarchaeota archaeon]|jgi:large subunit ribosomal protein L19e|nr:50S ribosomal protein L19e [Candidatus Lokiarchaeota archaeon]MBD3200768.1 50S ribosomal protein L19e [Candidatus Lokiarchaeota archaeon]
MNLNAQKRMAAEILKCGENRVYFDPYLMDEIKMAITREDIRNLVKEGVIRKKYEIGISNYRKKQLHERKKKGRAKGLGKRKGTKKARTPKKKAWIKRIRPIRRELKKLRDRKLISKTSYRRLYKNAKGGMFTSVAHLNRYIKEHDLIKRGR